MLQIIVYCFIKSKNDTFRGEVIRLTRKNALLLRLSVKIAFLYCQSRRKN